MKSKSDLVMYYMSYCEKVMNHAATTREHYLRGLRKVSSFLKSKGLIETDIYDIQNIEQLESLKAILSKDPDFTAFNSKGHNMYFSALSAYIKFASGQDCSEEKIRVLDQPMPVRAAKKVERIIQPRLEIVKHQVLEAAGYRCALNSEHTTFIVEGTDRQYMEGHHIISMSLQDQFVHSLDVYANIVCLCPTCHRKIHYGGIDDRRSIAMYLYTNRAERLEKSGLELTKDSFVALVAPDRSLKGREKLAL